MTRPLLLLCLFVLPVSLCHAQQAQPAQQTQTQSNRAIAVATAFVNDLIGDSAVESLMNLCTVPFCHDDTAIVLTRDQLKTSLSQLLHASALYKEKTHPRVDSAYVLDVRKEVLFGMVPINIDFTVISLKFTIQGKEVNKLLILAVQLTDEAKIVGIQQ